LPHDAGWRIATSSLGNSVRDAFFGVGPGHFVDAFTLNKPVNLNNSPLWNARFQTSSNFYFYLLTTLGIIGLASFLLLVARVVPLIRREVFAGSTEPLAKGILASAALGLGLVLLLPAGTTTILALFTALGLLGAYYKLHGNHPFARPANSAFMDLGEVRLGVVLTTALILGFTYYFIARLLLGDYFFANSIRAAAQNRGNDTYNNQIQALRFNPWTSSYRVAYSQTNLALADALAGQPNLTDQQRQAVVTLVQQSIREARAAASLDPNRAANWENLSLIYRNLINYAQGADQWAIATENQAITLEPLNPRLRLDLGGIYFALGNYQLAGQVFAQAVNLKPDYANAHYNLAQALRNLNQNDQALAQLQLTASIVCAQSQAQAECQKVNDEITALGSTPASPAAGLTTPGTPTEIEPASPSGQNLENARPEPPAVISSPSGELAE
jgi:hypothetical protein